MSDDYEVRIDVRLYRRGTGESIGMSESFNYQHCSPGEVFGLLAKFSDVAEKVKAEKKGTAAS